MPDHPLTRVDLGSLAGGPAAGEGTLWALPGPGELGAALYSLPPRGSVADHANREADLLLVGVSGTADVVVEGHAADLSSGVLIHVAKGARRRITAGEGGACFLTVHRSVASSRGRRGPRAARDEPAQP